MNFRREHITIGRDFNGYETNLEGMQDGYLLTKGVPSRNAVLFEQGQEHAQETQGGNEQRKACREV